MENQCYYSDLFHFCWYMVVQNGFIFCSIYYKKLQRCWKPAVNQDGGDAISNVPAPAKPVLGLYLIGWGLGVILCGIVAAINNLQHYDNQD